MKSKLGWVVVVMVLLVGVVGCRGHRAGGGDATDTIAPATPDAAPESDPAMTQTVEIGEERSPNEGGVLTDPNSPLGVETSSTDTAAGTATDTTATNAPRKTSTSR